MRSKAVFMTTLLLISSVMLVFLPPTSADNDSTTANILIDSTTNYICFPDCGSEGVDEFDWYRVTLEPYTTTQVFVENLDDIASVDMRVSVYTTNPLNLDQQFDAGANDNQSVFLNNSNSSPVDYLIEITTVDGWGDDGSNYVISRNDETDNFWQTAMTIQPGSFLPEGVVCISNCDNNVVDSEDWYQVSFDANQQVAIVAEELSWFTYLDFEIYQLVNGSIQSFSYEYHGGSAGGLQDYSVRAWFNTTVTSTYLIRVYTPEPDSVQYNLSVSIGTWVDVLEDDFHWVSFPDVKFGDEIRVQAVRTDSPNDLDVLMFNAEAFEEYRLGVADGSGSSPDELLAEEDCLVCSIQFQVSAEDSGLLNVKPETTHDLQQAISWSPTLFLVADYTDYRSNPPANNQVDTAHIFLSVSILQSQSPSENYELYQQELNGEWTLINTGTTTSGSLDAPIGGWSSQLTETGDGFAKTIYRVEVRDGTSNVLLSNSTFEVTNFEPIAKMQIGGDIGGEFKQGIPVYFDGSASWDGDNDALTHSWRLDGIELSNEPIFEAQLNTGNYLLEYSVTDTHGSLSQITQSLSVEPITLDGFSQNTTTTLPNETIASITSSNVNYQETSIAPSWTEFSFISTGIGIGINAESRITQTTQYDLVIDYSENQTTFSKQNMLVTTETALKMNLAVFVRDLGTNNITIYDMPMPSEGQIYEGQSWFPVGLFDRVYYWGELAVIDSTASSEMTSEVSLDVEIPALDLMDYITSIASNIPGSQVPLLALSIAIDYNLYIDIDLQVDVSTNGTVVDMVVQSDSSTPELLPVAPVELFNQESMQYFSYSSSETALEIFGSIGLRLRIAQPGWLTTGLGFIVEDPMFLEGEWEAKLVNSSGPIGLSNSKGHALSDQLVSILVNQTVLDEVENNSTEDNTDNDNQANETNGTSNTDADPTNQTNQTDQNPDGLNQDDLQQNQTETSENTTPSSEAFEILDYVLYGGITAVVLILLMLGMSRRRRKPPSASVKSNQSSWETSNAIEPFQPVASKGIVPNQQQPQVIDANNLRFQYDPTEGAKERRAQIAQSILCPACGVALGIPEQRPIKVTCPQCLHVANFS